MNNQVNLELEVDDSQYEQQMTMMEAGEEPLNFNQVEVGDLDIFGIFENQLLMEEAAAEAEDDSDDENDSDTMHQDMTDIKYLILGLAKKMKNIEKDLRIVKKQ